MASILIRNVSPETLERLRQRARRNGRSLQAEALAALDAHGPYSGTALAEKIKQLRADGAIPPFDVRLALEALADDRAR